MRIDTSYPSLFSNTKALNWRSHGGSSSASEGKSEGKDSRGNGLHHGRDVLSVPTERRAFILFVESHPLSRRWNKNSDLVEDWKNIF